MTDPEDKKGGWRIVPNESWRAIVAEYANRIDRIRQYDPWNHPLPRDALGATTKECPFSPSDDPKVLCILKRLSIFGGTTAFTAIQVAQTICDLWESGNFILVPMNTRFIMECWSRVHYAIDVLNKLARTGDIDKAEERIDRLTFGTRSEITLPWGGKSNDIESIHINDCLQTLGDIYPEYQASYDFLSESSHPSFTENMYFMMAGPPIANWNNAAYKKTMKPMLDRCFSIFEKCIDGLLVDSFELMSLETVVSDSLSKEVENEP